MNLVRCKIPAAMSLCAVVLIPGQAFGALINRGGGLIYDTDRDITWLADANYGAGSFYDTNEGYEDGLMSWASANAWATNLSYYDSVRGVTYDDWRLPTTLYPDPSCNTPGYGTNCTGSEMGHLFYDELQGIAGQSILVTHNSSFDLFTNIQPYRYWSTTESEPRSFNYEWYFDFSNGFQYDSHYANAGYAWAVRPGDVAVTSTVPVPAAAWLFGSGLLSLVGMARRKAA
jgi:hypothetical protein